LPWVLRAFGGGRAGVAGWFGLSMWGGLALGPVAAAVVANFVDVATVWYVVVGLGATSAILVLSTVDNSERKPLPHIGLRDLVPHGAALPGVLIGLGAYGYGTVSALLVLYLRVDHLGGDSVALGVFGGAFLLTRAVGAPLADRFAAVKVLAVALTLQTAGLLGVALAAGTLGALLATAVAGIGLALLYPSAVALTLGRADRSRPGASLGAMTSFWDLGIMAAGPVSGAVAQFTGFPTAFALAAGVTVVALLVVAAYAVRRTRTAPTTQT
jgi:MFS family permease